MGSETPEARGQVMIRPWRVGLVIDTSSPVEVRGAIADLSSVWGGISMPIFDSSTSVPELEAAGNAFNVDSLYAGRPMPHLDALLSKPGWRWRGSGEWGPFGGSEDTKLRKGLLRIREFLHSESDLIQPEWDANNPSDLAFAAIWGLSNRLGMPQKLIPIKFLEGLPGADSRRVGILAANTVHVKHAYPHDGTQVEGIYVLRPDHPQDVVDFWDLRAFGGQILGVPSQAEPWLVRFLLSGSMPLHTVQNAASDSPHQELSVIGLENASDAVAATIEEIASQAGARVFPTSSPGLPQFVFRGLETSFKRKIRADFPPKGRWIDVDLPGLPIVDRPNSLSYYRGIVAAEVELHDVHRQDPRFTFHIPPYRRHATLLEHPPFIQEVKHIRCDHGSIVFGVDAGVEDVRVPSVLNLDVLRLLFDDDEVTVAQSDTGKFQTRAAEKFGGPFSGALNQPGIREALRLAARTPTGVTLPHLRNQVENHRGSWPDPEVANRTSPKEYAIRAVNDFFLNGLFVPLLRVHCSSCRVENHVAANQLASTMLCEFCGESFDLALSNSLCRPEWRYRLAAHLRSDQVEALLPALATTSLLQQLRNTSEVPPLVLGLEVTLDKRTIECDIATYLGDNQYVAVLGEVKNHNRIDHNDIENLKFLRDKLRSKGVRCLLLFATMKDKFSDKEVAELRSLAEESELIRSSASQSILDLPLILTGPDLSHPFWDNGHPWRWGKHDYSGGLFKTARISCERNLGLRNYTHDTVRGRKTIRFTWDDRTSQYPKESPASPANPDDERGQSICSPPGLRAPA